MKRKALQQIPMKMQKSTFYYVEKCKERAGFKGVYGLLKLNQNDINNF